MSICCCLWKHVIDLSKIYVKYKLYYELNINNKFETFNNDDSIFATLDNDDAISPRSLSLFYHFYNIAIL